MNLTAVSLFAGVGGFDLAMTRAGIDVVASVEIDKHARSVLERRFPNTHHFTDVTEVTGEQLRSVGFIPERGIITGGFPCQDLSIAGKRAGLSGRRSGLFWEIARLLDELRPRWFVLENVPGLLSSNGGRDFGTVLGELVELGYGVSYSILDAQHFGVAQRRRRVFIVGHLGDDGRASANVLAIPESLSGGAEPSPTSGKELAGTLFSRIRNNGESGGANHLVPMVDGTLTAGDGTPDGVSGRTIVPTLLTMREGKPGGGKGPLLSENVSLTLATGNGQTLFQPYVKVIRSGARDDDGNLPPEVWAERDVSPTLNVMDNTGESRATVLVAPMVRRLTPVECERLQGFPDGWTEGQSDAQRYKQMGNAVAVPVVEWIMNRLVTLIACQAAERHAPNVRGPFYTVTRDV